MDDDNVDQGLDADLGTHVEDARGYDPEESEDGIVDKIKNALGGDSDDPDDANDGDGLLDESDDELTEDDEDLI